MFLTIFFVISLISSSYADCSVLDYRWQDYDGVGDDDALIASSDDDNSELYLGQVLYKNSLIPGKVLAESPYIEIVYENERVTLENNIKIFTSQNSTFFQWWPVIWNNILLPDDMMPVEVGYQNGFKFIYAGRAHAAGQHTIGKVLCTKAIPRGCQKLQVINDDGKVIDVEKYELLVYNSCNE